MDFRIVAVVNGFGIAHCVDEYNGKEYACYGVFWENGEGGYIDDFDTLDEAIAYCEWRA